MSMYDYPSDWRSRRQEVFARDGYLCLNCGQKGGEKGNAELRAHHILPRERGGSHDTSNLVCVCLPCRDAIESDNDASSGHDRSGTNTSRIHTIDDFRDLTDAIGHIETIDEAVTNCAAHVLGEGEVGEGDLVRNGDDFHLRARDIKNEIIQSKAMFANQTLDFDSPAVASAHDDMNDEIFVLLQVFLEIVLNFEAYLDLLSSTRCPECGNYDEYTEKLCSECSREMPVVWECLQCRTNITDLSQDYCSDCGNELAIFPPRQREELDDLRADTYEVVKEWRAQSDVFMDVVKNEIVPAHKNS